MTTVKQLAKTFGKNEKEVEAKYDEYYKMKVEEGREESVAKSMALRLTQLFYKKQTIGAPTEKVKCIVIGQKEPMDSAQMDRDKAAEMFAKNPKKAIAEGWTDKNGTALDRKKDFGKDAQGKLMENRNFGKPIRPNWMRILSIFDLSDNKAKTFILKGDQAMDMNVPMFKIVELNGKYNETNMVYNGTKSTVLVEEPNLTPAEEKLKDFKEVMKFLAPLTIDITNVEEWVQTHGNKDILVTEADVVQIDFEPNQTGSRTVILDNMGESGGQRMFVPQIVPITFGEMSRIVVIASAKPGKGDYGPSMTAMGMWPIPEFLCEMEDVENYDKPIDHNSRQERFKEQEADENGPTEEQMAGADVPDEPESLKIATATLIMKVVAMEGDNGISADSIEEQAIANGYSVESIMPAIAAAIDQGFIICDEGIYYTSE